MDQALVFDVVEIEQLLARYALAMSRGDIDSAVAVFAPDGTFGSFGQTRQMSEFVAAVENAPKGLFLVGTPVVEIDGNRGTGHQPMCFVNQTTHETLIGYYNDTYSRTAEGWRIQTRSLTFLRRSGVQDSGNVE